MTEPTTYSSISEAMRRGNIPMENYSTVTAIVEAIGIESFHEHSKYGIRAVRRDPGPDLWIAYGNTSGFASEDEARRAAPHLQPWRNGRSSTWGVTHPENKNRDGNGPKREKPTAVVCGDCFMEKASDGSCGCG